ncbi:DUF4388 domain-containing protein [Deinococcus hohokamensis]|uniref:DUF4388 domain-containing protein n=1 Tax=Deinococcus hohokamensis TaxID=309883 RepID=A0ABV9IBU1_9DEIO
MVRGDLSVFPLLSVMQMLLGSGRAGRLSVDHPRGGQLWLDPGELVHAQAGSLTGDAALQVVASLDEGTFTFEADEMAPDHTLALRRDAALRRMLDDHESWRPLLGVFPDWDRTLRFSSRWSEAQPVTRPQYEALQLLQGGATVRSLFERSPQPPRALLETLRPFLSAGLIELA